MKKLLTAAYVVGFALATLPFSAQAEGWDVADMNDHIDQTNFIVGEHCSATLISLEERLLLTNDHCVDNYISIKTEKVTDKDGVVTEIKVEKVRDIPVSQKMYNDHQLVSRSSYIGDLAGRDKDLDLALIKLRIENLPHSREAKVFTGDKLYRGETVYAVGNPMGLDASVTKGVISNTNRLLRVGYSEKPYIQMDAGIVGGSSGGALYNNKGELVGVPAAAAPGTSVGLAIPIYRIRDFLDDNCFDIVWKDIEESECETTVEDKE